MKLQIKFDIEIEDEEFSKEQFVKDVEQLSSSFPRLLMEI